jgi:hypothetical protein
VTLTKAGREEIALALILWKDFKSQGKLDLEISTQCIQLVKELGVTAEFEALLPKVPPMLITERYPRT